MYAKIFDCFLSGYAYMTLKWYLMRIFLFILVILNSLFCSFKVNCTVKPQAPHLVMLGVNVISAESPDKIGDANVVTSRVNGPVPIQSQGRPVPA